MGIPVVVTHPDFLVWSTAYMTRQTNLDIAAGIQIAASIVAIEDFYSKAEDAVDDRDVKIDAQIAFMQTLENFKEDQDLPMVICKKDILTDLGLPTIDKCYSASINTNTSSSESIHVINKTTALSNETNQGVPNNWRVHEPMLQSSKADNYVSGISSNAEKRRVESFRGHQLSLTLSGHQGIKSVYNSSDTLSKYSQAAAIHSGLADLYIQGFNSAGAALGAGLSKLSGMGRNQINNSPDIQTGLTLGAGSNNNVQNTA